VARIRELAERGYKEKGQAPMPKILEAQALGVRINDRVLLRDVNLAVERGDAVLVLGPNGAGKTVLLKALLGLLPHEGSLSWYPPAVRIGYLPQRVNVDTHLPLCGRNLLEAKAHILKLETRDIRDALTRVGLGSNVVENPLGHLSGGQLQKVLIAFALLGNPEVLMLDEPTTGLDEPSAEHIYDLARRVRSEGITVILVSHDLGLAYHFATKVLCLDTRALCFGAPAEALTRSTMEALYGVRDGEASGAEAGRR
jgi:zinc transport system ATP-binding protein